MFEVQDCSDVAFQVAMDYSYLLSMRVFVKECRNVETGHQKAEAALKSIRYVSALADFPTGELLVDLTCTETIPIELEDEESEFDWKEFLALWG